MALKKIKDWKDETKSLLIRMWTAGAVALFIAWTPVGGGELEGDAFLFPIIFMLALGLTITNIALVNPVIRGMFRTKMDRTKYWERPLAERVGRHILHFIEMIIIVILIWIAYILINYLLGLIGITGHNDRPFIMLEPITFGIIYGFYFHVLETLKYRFFHSKTTQKKD